MIRRIALVVGDTPGHFYPALAVAEAYGRAEPMTEVLFFGPAKGVAAGLAARYGCSYQPVSASQLVRVGAGGRLRAVPRALFGVLQARRALRRQGTKLVIGFGGYASGPVVLAARTLGLATAIHEANVWPGLANRWLGRVTDRVYLNFAAAGSHFPSSRQRVVGWPVRNGLSQLVLAPRLAPSIDRPARILVLGGTRLRDTQFLTSHAPALLAHVARLGVALEARHQTDVVDAQLVLNEYERACVRAAVTSLIDPIAEAYEWADFVIARAGAGTIAELAIAGLPALLVPLGDAAEDHQALNAQTFAEAGGGFWAREEAWNPDALAARIGALLRDPRAWEAASAATRRLAKPDAAERVVTDCEALMRGRW